MGKKLIFSRFNSITDAAETYNSRNSYKRFWPIQSRKGKFWEFGMYDYKSKKYILSTPTSDLNHVFDEIEGMLSHAGQ